MMVAAAVEQLSRGEKLPKTQMSANAPFKLTNVALVARMKVFADILGTGAG